MKRRILGGIAGFFIFMQMLRPRKPEEPIELRDFDLRPGPWFAVYLNDWMEYFDIDDADQATSGIARGESTDEYIWATATPVWDLQWFNSHGWRFPRRWVPFHYLLEADGEPGDPIRLRGL